MQLRYADRKRALAQQIARVQILMQVKTVVQVICIWFLALVLIPGLILGALGQPLLPTAGPHVAIGGILLLLGSGLGLWSSFVLVRYGKGTPLPLDQTNQLVTEGPYGFIRNPMAVAGIGQGVAVGVVYASMPIVVYAALGAIVWHLVVRPLEERDMEQRFGDSYRTYQAHVDCWIPRLRSRSR